MTDFFTPSELADEIGLTLPSLMFEALLSVAAERAAQDEKWGVQWHSWPEWIAILTEEVGEAAQCTVNEHWHLTGDLGRLRIELVQTAAVAVRMIEHIDELANGAQ